MKKYYAVRKGRQVGLFNDWMSCEKQIKGYSGAEYKSFKTREEAEAYLFREQMILDRERAEETRYPCAYVDGSYDAASGQFAFGAVIMADAEQERCFSKRYEDAHLATMRNVAGEIKGSEFAIQYAVDQGWSQIYIYYDYYGIEKWALGEWKRNLEATQAYHTFCQNAFEKIEVIFIKVKGHSGNKYNDMADALARKALDL